MGFHWPHSPKNADEFGLKTVDLSAIILHSPHAISAALYSQVLIANLI